MDQSNRNGKSAMLKTVLMKRPTSHPTAILTGNVTSEMMGLRRQPMPRIASSP